MKITAHRNFVYGLQRKIYGNRLASRCTTDSRKFYGNFVLQCSGIKPCIKIIVATISVFGFKGGPFETTVWSSIKPKSGTGPSFAKQPVFVFAVWTRFCGRLWGEVLKSAHPNPDSWTPILLEVRDLGMFLWVSSWGSGCDHQSSARSDYYQDFLCEWVPERDSWVEQVENNKILNAIFDWSCVLHPGLSKKGGSDRKGCVTLSHTLACEMCLANRQI